MRGEHGQLKDMLIQKGIVQLTVGGVEHFSLRETAKSCGVSCAAPFKHFKDKADYFQEISHYLDDELLKQVIQAEKQGDGNLWRIYQETSYAYVDYLIAHPFLMNLSFWNDMGHYRRMGIRDWKSLSRVICNFNQYCSTLSLSESDYQRVFFAMQHLTYGLAFMATSKMLDEKEDYSSRLLVDMESIFYPYQ